MQINVTPHKLAAQEIEVFLDAPASPLALGQVLRFEAASPFYGEIIELTEEAQGILRAKLTVCYGEPKVPFHLATLLHPAALYEEIQHLREGTEYPFALGSHYTASLLNLGTLTLLTGQTLPAKQKALLQFMRGIAPYQKLLVLDPVGIFSDGEDVHILPAGSGFHLTLQQVGFLRFLSAFEKTLPEALRPEALQLCTQALPESQNNLPFGYLLQRERYPESPSKAMLFHSLGEVARTRLFSESDGDAFSFSKVLKAPMNVLNLSTAPPPWRALLYEALCQEILKYPETDAVFVLVYPERYLAEVLPWLTQAEALRLTLIVLATPEEKPALRSMANNHLHVQAGEALLRGALTLGFPVSLWANMPVPEAHTSKTPEPLILETPPAPMDIPIWREKPLPIDTSDIPPAPAWEIPSVEELSFALPEEELQEKELSFDALEEEELSPQALEFDELEFDLAFLDIPELSAPEAEPEDEPEGIQTQVTGSLETEDEKALEPQTPEAHEETWAEEELAQALSTEAEPEMEGIELPEQDIIPVYRTHELEQQALNQESGYQAGERIRHEKYGIGLITKVIPMDSSVVLNITFESVGKRLLDPSLTVLEKV